MFVQSLGYGRDNRGFSLLLNVQTGCAAHRALCPKVTAVLNSRLRQPGPLMPAI
jgi:hypothetical protein